MNMILESICGRNFAKNFAHLSSQQKTMEIVVVVAVVVVVQ